MDFLDYLIVALAAVGAGAINALAGGGTLISFPALLAAGLSPVSANVTSTVALVPGYLGGLLAQLEDVKPQKKRLRWTVPAGVFGGLLGGWLLLQTDEKLFGAMVPYLILMAAGLLAVQGPMRKWLVKRTENVGGKASLEKWAWIPLIGAAMYGGYFGAGLGVITLATLGLFVDDNLTKLNALKQSVSLSVNLAAAIFFVFRAPVNWPVAVIMAGGSLAGGVIGGKLAGKVKPEVLRWVVVGIGVVVAAIYILRG